MIVAGIVVFVLSWPLGGVVFGAAMDLLSLLGAPEERQILSPDVPGAGGQILRLLGGAVVACGVCIVSVRLAVELVGLPGRPGMTANLAPADRLSLGAAVFGALAVVSTGLSHYILYEIFLYEFGRGAAMVSLETAARIGAAFLIVGLAVLILRRPRFLRALLGWADRVGWGRVGWGWLNRLGLGSIAVGLVSGMLTPGFPEALFMIALAGVVVLAAGIVPHVLAGRGP